MALDLNNPSINYGEERAPFLPFEDLGFAKIDHHRAIRCGFPEVIYCEGKTLEQVVGITRRMLKAGSDILATRASETRASCCSAEMRSLPSVTRAA
jgi:NCAIR mutase (PurE)-related protein